MASHLNENVEQFYLSLLDLKSNSKPMIAMLTQLAEEYKESDKELVQTIQDVVYEVTANRKLLYLYLIDSICKHVGLEYVNLFSHCLVPLFYHVYLVGSSEVKRSMIKLRKTWSELFPDHLLIELDKKMKPVDTNWPFKCRIRTRSSGKTAKMVHNLNFLSSLQNNHSKNELQSIQPFFKTNQHSLPANNNSALSARSLLVHSAAQINEGQMSNLQGNYNLTLNQQTFDQQPVLSSLSSHLNQQQTFLSTPANQNTSRFSSTSSSSLVFNRPSHCNSIETAFLNRSSLFVNNHAFINNQFIRYSNLNSCNNYESNAFAANLSLHQNQSNLNACVHQEPSGSFNINLINVNENIKQNFCLPLIESSTKNSSCVISCQTKPDFAPVKLNQSGPTCLKYGNRDNNNKIFDKCNRKRFSDSSASSPVKSRPNPFDSLNNLSNHHRSSKAISKFRDANKYSEQNEIPVLELKPESLRVKRDHLIKQLYNGLQCTSCSLRFDVQSKDGKEKYSNHLDWHFRKNRKSRNKIAHSSYNLKRKWYYPLDQWLQFKEITLDSDNSCEKQFNQLAAIHTSDKICANKQNKPSRIKANPDDSLNVCLTCFENFNEIWCDEEECWLLENATLINRHYYHQTCLIDEQVQMSSNDINNQNSTSLDLNNTKSKCIEPDEKSGEQQAAVNNGILLPGNSKILKESTSGLIVNDKLTSDSGNNENKKLLSVLIDDHNYSKSFYECEQANELGTSVNQTPSFKIQSIHNERDSDSFEFENQEQSSQDFCINQKLFGSRSPAQSNNRSLTKLKAKSSRELNGEQPTESIAPTVCSRRDGGSTESSLCSVM